MPETLNITVLGSTGSIGVNTLDVISRQHGQWNVFAISAYTNIEKLFEQCRRFAPRYAVVNDEKAATALESKLRNTDLETVVRYGPQALCEIAADDQVDIVMASIVGAAGLASTMAAIEAGKKVLIANKEPIVMLGELIIRKAAASGAQILPVDSEHNAIMQCLPDDFKVVQNRSLKGVERLILTGSGGPFRTTALDKFDSITPSQACNHPNWVMGRKISVDSATMMNKALELIEACVLFGVDVNKVDILIHPQSIIHSMVEYIDGSVIAQMGSPDMRIAIASALAWPRRIKSGSQRLDFLSLSGLEFERPDYQRYPSLRIVNDAINTGGTAPCVMNAANEIAVEAFINELICFSDIVNLVERTLEQSSINPSIDLQSVLLADTDARVVADELLKHYSV